MHSVLGTIPTISEKDAASLLVTQSALGDLEFKDALRIVSYMKPKRIKEGAVFIREGEKINNDFMMLMLHGQARVETQMQGAVEPVTMAVLSAGQLIGEIGTISGDARSASCIAITELAVGVITRQALTKMMRTEPELAARMLLAISSRMAKRLSESTQKLKRFMQLNQVLHQEVYTLMDAPANKKASKPSKPSGFEATEPMSLEALHEIKAKLTASRKA